MQKDDWDEDWDGVDPFPDKGLGETISYMLYGMYLGVTILWVIYWLSGLAS